MKTVIFEGTSEVHGADEFARGLAEGRALIKIGCDPTAPDLHLGHLVALRKVRELQDAGARAVLVVGDFTASIGDPSGRNKTRPVLDPAEIDKNAATYEAQAVMILDPAKTSVERNSRWLSRMGAADMLRLAASSTLGQMLERHDFARRHADGSSVGLHEFLYPLLQARDSVVLKPSMEVGGTDQTFNCMAGRDLMRKEGLEPQAVLTVPLLRGLDGVKKMSKSMGNHIGISEPPADIYGKIMSVSDDLMWEWIGLLSPGRLADAEREREFVSGGGNPMEAKARLAFSVVSLLAGEPAAKAAEQAFRDRSRLRNADSETMPPVTLPAGARTMGVLLREASLAASSSEGERLVRAGAVHVDGERVTDPKAVLPGGEFLVRAGKRNVRKIRIG